MPQNDEGNGLDFDQMVEDKKEEIPEEHMEDVIELAIISTQEYVANLMEEMASRADLDVEINRVRDDA